MPAVHRAQDTLARCRRVLGKNHPQTLYWANHLANKLRRAGIIRQRGASARTPSSAAGDPRDNHPNTLVSVNNFAIDLANLGEQQAACNLGEDTLSATGGSSARTIPKSSSRPTPSLAICVRWVNTSGFANSTRTSDPRHRQILGEAHPVWGCIRLCGDRPGVATVADQYSANIAAPGNTP